MRASSSSSFIDADAGSVTDGVDVPSSPPAVAAISVTVRHHRCISATPRGGTARHVTHLGDGLACVLLARLGPVCTPRTHADALIEPPTRTTVRPRTMQQRRGKSRLRRTAQRGFERRPPRGEKSELTAHAHAGDRSRGAVVIRLLSTTFTRRRGSIETIGTREAVHRVASSRRARAHP